VSVFDGSGLMLGREVVGAIVGAIFGGVEGALSARTTQGNWVTGMVIGAATGFGIGLIDPTLGIGTMAAIGGGASFLGSVGGQLWDGKAIDWWGVGGASVGGALGGAFGGMYGIYAGAGAGAPLLTQLGEAALGGLVGAPMSYISEVAGTALGSGGSIPSGKPWNDSGTLAHWLRAAGCKP